MLKLYFGKKEGKKNNIIFAAKNVSEKKEGKK